MKKSKIPKLEELVNRYVKCIEFQNPEKPKITAGGKLFLKSQWLGQEEKLYKMVKDLEVKVVQTKNLTERFETRSCTFQVGVNILGQPTYTTHESLFQYNLDHKKNITATALVDSIQYNHN
jgi:hypothetical protein